MKDLFSASAREYFLYRPNYPADLFQYLASISPSFETAWDAATGNGQAALGLSPYFRKVIATDISEKQLSQAPFHENIRYYRASAEHSLLPDKSIDLITVAQAFHWFNQTAFGKEIKRIAKQNGILAIWCYQLFTSGKDIDDIVAHLYSDVLKDCWEPERALVDSNYENIEFPFEKLPEKTFTMQAKWDLKHLVGYLRTWSAYRRFQELYHADPITPLMSELSRKFPGEHILTWRITPRVFRIS